MTGITVLHVVPDLRRQAGGIAATVPALARALDRQGVVSHFVTFASDGDVGATGRTILAARSDARRPARLDRLIRQVLAELPAQTVLHSHGLWDMLNHAALRAATGTGRACVLSPHGMLLPWARRHRKWRKDLAWWLYQRGDLMRADLVHVTSEDEARGLAALLGPDGLAQIPFGVDLPALMPWPDGAAPRLLFLGRLHPVKNLDTLIRAFVSAAPAGWTLRLAGPDEGGYRATLERLVADLGARPRVSFAGAVYGADKMAELAATSALILPSHTENFGAVVAEALAAGRPVIASRGTPWQALAEARCGWWVAPDQASLAAAISDLARTPPATLTQMGARGRDMVAASYSWDRVATDMARLYTGLASRRPAGHVPTERPI